MANTETLAKVKKALRISHDKLDDDILDNVSACLADLKVHGILNPQETDPLILNAIKLYARAQYTDDPAKAADYLARYKEMRSRLQDAEGYGWAQEVAADD
jgi:uncharacterized phage protein (predicted DNA packaging)